ncbi:MAG TPA: hypothetical protein VNM87_14985, partial [Candidatus Udaeobacter sp.]|nr:hypothetical protein [Candidatus Udaeobacter sp.]
MSKAYRLSALLVLLTALVWSIPAGAGLNPNFSLPLHAEGGHQGCGPLAVDCLSNRPTVNIAANTDVTIYLMVSNHNSLAGVQTAFEWDAGWVHVGSLFDCAPGQLNAVVPAAPGGPKAGSVVTAFNCVTSGQLLILGRMWMTSGASGCLHQVESSYPFGNHAVDCL